MLYVLFYNVYCVMQVWDPYRGALQHIQVGDAGLSQAGWQRLLPELGDANGFKRHKPIFSTSYKSQEWNVGRLYSTKSALCRLSSAYNEKINPEWLPKFISSLSLFFLSRYRIRCQILKCAFHSAFFVIVQKKTKKPKKRLQYSCQKLGVYFLRPIVAEYSLQV